MEDNAGFEEVFFLVVVVVFETSLRFFFVFVSSSRIILTVTTPAANWSRRIDYSNPSFSPRGDEEDKDEEEGDEEGFRVQFSDLLLLLFLLLKQHEHEQQQQTLVRGHRIRFGPTGNLRAILPRDAEHPRGRGEQSIGETRSGFYNHRAGVLL